MLASHLASVPWALFWVRWILLTQISSQKPSIFTAQQGLTTSFPFCLLKEQKFIHFSKEQDGGGFAWQEQTKLVPTSWMPEAMGRAELMPELAVPGELWQARSRSTCM